VRNKLITLDEESFAISKEMKNFSSFVRMATKATREGGVDLVNPATMPPMQCLAIVLGRFQTEERFEEAQMVFNLITELKRIQALEYVNSIGKGN